MVHLHVISPAGKVFLQRRSLYKDTFPGYWDTAVGGHLGLNESVLEGLRREALEEIGLIGFDPLALGVRRVDTPCESELVYSFLTVSAGPFCLDPAEIADGRFWDPAEIEAGLGSFTPNFEQDWPTLRAWLDKNF
ncbi:MAG: putative Nudix hydrolase YfcD [Deltaproteobacteria bacterium ADurb.Bin510]|nr:MAG: putative Nudix hydrolase YfcD [Deltaproteobacteria bacterium ADurb.Bin510]